MSALHLALADLLSLSLQREDTPKPAGCLVSITGILLASCLWPGLWLQTTPWLNPRAGNQEKRYALCLRCRDSQLPESTGGGGSAAETL